MPSLTSAVRNCKKQLLLAFLALVLLLAVGVSGAAHQTDMLNGDTRKFLKLLAAAFPEVGQAWRGKLQKNFCVNTGGIVCDPGLHTISLHFAALGTTLTGSLPELSDDINGSRVMVESVKASSVGITGSLPNSWGRLTHLSQLILSGNSLTGTLPASYSGLANLQELWLNENQISGSLPAEWGKGMSNVETILLNQNTLTGTLPDSWGKLSNLASLDISDNQLEGGLPDWTGADSLMYVELDHNNMKGTLSASFAKLPFLQTLRLGHNAFCGCVAEGWNSNRVLRQALNGMGANGEALRAADCATANACTA